MKLLRAATIIAMLSFVLMTSCKKDTEVITSDPSTETSTDLLKNKPGDVNVTKGPTSPANDETGVPLNQVITVNFNDGISPEQISKTSITLKQERMEEDDDDDDMKSESEGVHGTLSYTETSASFTPDKNLDPNTRYKASVKTKSHDKHGEDHEKKGYDWHFTTGAAGVTSAPSVTMSDPVNNATSVAFNKAIVITFSEAMDPLTISTSTFILKQGATLVTGSISYTGNKATFTPAVSLTPNQVYTGTITTGAMNLTGVALVNNYTFSFTTGAIADVTAPVVLTTNPTNSATSVALNATVGITFSEAMNSSTISTSTIKLMQGSTAIAGAVTYTGNTATFTPSANFIAGAAYTVTVTTGVKDLAGNALAANSVSGLQQLPL
jgi:methionine-rich copper-binding protein CopC